MIVARNASRLRDTLILDGGLQHHALIELIDNVALDFLPRRLARRIGIAVLLILGAAIVELLLRDQDIGRALVQIDAHAIARAQQRKAAADRGLWRGVKDRRRA